MNKKIITWILSLLVLFAVVLFATALYFGQFSDTQARATSLPSAQLESNEGSFTTNEITAASEVSSKNPSVVSKSAEAKQAVMDADLATMDAYGLYYDYANMSLSQVVQAYLDEFGIDHSQVAFSYKNPATGELIEMNETQAMTAGSTYKLPLNMMVVDDFKKLNLSMTERYDITNTYYEYDGEHNNYVAAFGGAMTIPEMQEYSLVYSENTPAYALADRLGGMDEVYKMYGRYGESKGEIKTISQENRTTTNYYIQVLQHLWDKKEKYKDIRYYIGVSFPGEYYKKYLPDLHIEQKPGYVNEALNVDAIVYEETPYLIALYTAGLGGTTTESTEISGVGLVQVGQLAYVINEWHRVNMNP
ncbi:hypothetical protein STRDD10_01429 [Streptococcus sp. DD10]|uniref:serine hydrolase n=1 Tax=Streptococcus sp. DD10 TaxID=1777878 RepID=UPI0007918CEC|nr:serine hydrolase [Streptococcus sp. DD10]KXT73623.1 hypothetical protein STRDD10_01429 [Streptococcus sp. DD10]